MTPLKDWSKGINKDQPSYELGPGLWSDGTNVRFRAGSAEFMGGIATSITPSVIPYAMLGYSSGATPYLFYAGIQRAYVHDGSTETQITRGPVPVTARVFSSGGGTTVIQTGPAVAHGLSTGDQLTLYGIQSGFESEVGNLLSLKTITVTAFDKFSVAATADFLGSTPSINYSVTKSTAYVTFTGSQDDKVTVGNFNGVLIYNNPVDGLFYWNQTVFPGNLATLLGTTYIADAARIFKNYLVLLAPTISGTKYRHQVLWSEAAEPGSVPTTFTASDTNDAGEVDQVSDGGLVDGCAWGDSFILYKRDCRFLMRYIGGNSVFDFNRITGDGDDGLLAANCVANSPKGQVFLTDGLDVRIHNGGVSTSLIEGKWRKWLQTNINTTYKKRSFVVSHPYKKEIWICVPTVGTLPDKVIVWNWEDDTLGSRELSNATFAASGEFPTAIAPGNRMLLANSTPKIGLVESGVTDFGSAMTQMLERQGMDMDSFKFKTLNASQPAFQASSAFVGTVYHGSSKTQGGTVTYATGQTYTHGTTQSCMAISPSGRYLAWKYSGTASDVPTLRTLLVDVKEQGGW